MHRLPKLLVFEKTYKLENLFLIKLLFSAKTDYILQPQIITRLLIHCREIHFDPVFGFREKILGRKRKFKFENFPSTIESRPPYQTESKRFARILRTRNKALHIYITRDLYLHTNVGLIISRNERVLVACKHKGTTRRSDSVRDVNSTKIVGVLSFRG